LKIYIFNLFFAEKAETALKSGRKTGKNGKKCTAGYKKLQRPFLTEKDSLL